MIEELLILPIEERESICEALRKSIIKERGEIMERHSLEWKERLMELSALTLGVKRIGNNRTRQNVIGRRMVIYELCLEGLTTTRIADLFGCTHMNIIHARKVMEDALRFPNSYKREVCYWNEFQKMLSNETFN